jgi:hypothetical protein
MSIPMCGEFQATVDSTLTEKDTENNPVHVVSLLLRGQGIGSCLGRPNAIEALRADVKVSVGYLRDGSFGSFAISDRATGQKKLVVSGWNYERYSPCDTGSSRGSTDCMIVANAKLLRQLSQSALTANSNYRLGRLARAAERACEHEGQDAGGSWPVFWFLSCQWELLEIKLREFTAFHACRAAKGRSCRVPDEKVGRPAKDVSQ